MKLRSVVAFALIALMTLGPLEGQVATVKHKTSPSFAAGFFYSRAYNYQTSVYAGGATAGGAYTIQVLQPFITTVDHRNFYPFNTFDPITIGQGAAKETVTPLSVSNCTGPVNPAGTYCTITATFTKNIKTTTLSATSVLVFRTGGTGSFAHDRRILTSGPGDRVAGHFLGSRTHV